MTYVRIPGNEKYEILNEYPFTIRNAKTKHEIKVDYKKQYPSVHLGNNHKTVHRIIATMFIDNPNDYPEIDHIDKNKQNYNLDNLIWTSRSMNAKNRNKYKHNPHIYLNELPKTAVKINKYKDIVLDRYYYDTENDKIIMLTKRNKYKYVNTSLDGHSEQFMLYDINDDIHKCRYPLFKTTMNNIYK